MISSVHKENTMSVLWYQKAAENQGLYLQGYNKFTDRLKEILQTPSDVSYSIVLDLDETVLDNSPYQVQTSKMVRPSILKIGMFKKKAVAKQYQVPKISFNMRIKTGFNHYISDRTPQVDDTIKNLEKEGILFAIAPPCSCRWRQIKRRSSPSCARKDRSCSVSSGTTWLTLADFKTSRLIAKLTNCKEFVKTSSSQSNVWIMGICCLPR